MRNTSSKHLRAERMSLRNEEIFPSGSFSKTSEFRGVVTTRCGSKNKQDGEDYTRLVTTLQESLSDAI